MLPHNPLELGRLLAAPQFQREIKLAKSKELIALNPLVVIEYTKYSLYSYSYQR